MAKRSNAAKMPGAENTNGKIKPRAMHPLTGRELERPCVKFPKLEMNGVVAAFPPAWAGDGSIAGWNITVAHPIADALAAADHALAVAIDDPDTAGEWDDLIPTNRHGSECTLQVCCDAERIQKFIRQAKRNGFKVVADDPGETKGGAE